MITTINRRGRTNGGRYTSRISEDTWHKLLNQPDELIQAKTELTQALGGMKPFYDWACTIEDHVILDAKAYIEAIQAKLAELETSP